MEGFSNIFKTLTEDILPGDKKHHLQQDEASFEGKIMHGSPSHIPKPDKCFIVDTNASNVEIGGVLSQIQGEERLIGYIGKTLQTREEFLSQPS